MSVDGDGTEHGNGGADEPGWDVDPDDESGVAVVAAVGRQIKAWREAAGMRAAEFGAAIGYGEDLVYKVEGGRRIPRPEFLDRSDEVLGAGGKLAAMKEDVAAVRYPKKVRDLAKLEAKAVELSAYGNHNLHGLLPTEEHPGTGGLIQVLKFPDGSAVGRSEGAFSGRPVSDPKQLRILELRYGMIRAQALTPRESLAFIEQVLGET